MKKQLLCFCLIAALLLSLCGCADRLPVVEDTMPYALHWGNSLAAQQGRYYALRGEKDGKVGLLLFDSVREKTHFLVEGDVYRIGMLGNKIYYFCLHQKPLYCYDLATRTVSETVADAAVYQITGNTLYYIPNDFGNFYCTMDLTTGVTDQVQTDEKVEEFWITGYGFYYGTREQTVLRVRPFGADHEEEIYRDPNALLTDVTEISGENIAFSAFDRNSENTSLIYYDAAARKTYEELRGNYPTFNYVRGHAVAVFSGAIYAVNITEEKVYKWGSPAQEYEYTEILDDCVIFFNGNNAYIQYYPKETAQN